MSSTYHRTVLCVCVSFYYVVNACLIAEQINAMQHQFNCEMHVQFNVMWGYKAEKVGVGETDTDRQTENERRVL